MVIGPRRFPYRSRGMTEGSVIGSLGQVRSPGVGSFPSAPPPPILEEKKELKVSTVEIKRATMATSLMSDAGEALLVGGIHAGYDMGMTKMATEPALKLGALSAGSELVGRRVSEMIVT